MKKGMILALCYITVLFAACNKQKPNEKFVGDYAGNGTVNGTISLHIGPGQTMNQDITDVTLPMSINLAAGEAKNEVILTYTNDEIEETYTTKGIVNDFDVDFDPVTIKQVIEGTAIDLVLDMEGSLNEQATILSLNGTVTGSGTIGEDGSSVPFDVDGTMTAELIKGATPDPDTPAADPALTLVEGEGYLSEGAEIEMGTIVTMGLLCKAEALKALKVEYLSRGVLIAEDEVEYDGVNTSDEYTSTFPLSQDIYPLLQEGEFTIKATLTDTQNKTVVLSFSITVTPAPTPGWEAHYQGTVTLSATATAMTYSYPFEAEDSMEIFLSQADEESQMNATITYGDNTYFTTGTKDGDNIDFEPFDIEIAIEESSVTVSLDMYGIIGDAILSVAGSLSGSGSITLPDIPFAIPATIEGGIMGDLDEIR